MHRVLVIRKDNYSEADVKRHYNNFHQILKPIFKQKSGYEISVHTNYNQPHGIGEEILKHLIEKK